MSTKLKKFTFSLAFLVVAACTAATTSPNATQTPTTNTAATTSPNATQTPTTNTAATTSPNATQTPTTNTAATTSPNATQTPTTNTAATTSPNAAQTPTTNTAQTNLQAGSYLGNYSISDAVFGTQTAVTVSGDTRIIITNALPNHETGLFPNSGNPNSISAQSDRYEYPANPTHTGAATEVRVPGVAVNGVKFEPGTAETVTCATGETYRVEGLQDTFNLGMDLNNAHVQPTGAYHYHGLSDLLAEVHAYSGGDLVHVGFAADGHLIYISITNTYASSYQLLASLRTGNNCNVSLGGRQGPNTVVRGTVPNGTYTSDWEYLAGSGDLDECNGTFIEDHYLYLITNEFPYISRCLKGEFNESRPSGPNSEQVPRDQTGSTLSGPNLAVASAQLGVTETQLRGALGPPPPDIEAAASSLGVTADALRAALDRSR